MNLKDYNGAIADYTKAIENGKTSANAYYNRGNSKLKLSRDIITLNLSSKNRIRPIINI